MSVTFRVGGLVIENGDTLSPDNLPKATETTCGGVIIGTNILVDKDGVISVENASTSNPGVVQLNDTTSSFSFAEELTANQGRLLQEQINAALPLAGGTMTGDINFVGGQPVDAGTY